MITERRHLRRQQAIALAGVAFVTVIVWKLVALQYVASESYTAQAETQQVKDTPVAPRRGRILDRNQRVLATSLEGQSFFVNNIADTEKLKSIAVRFSRRVGEDEAEVLRRVRGGRSFVWLARQVMDGPEPDELPGGVGRVVEMVRTYPLGPVAGQLIGYTNVDNVGIEGIERSFDRFLSGTPGELSTRIDARGRAVGVYGMMKTLPQDGDDLVLTIDADYQSIAEEELAAAVDSFDAESAVAIVMEPLTGEILAMANVPVYDPNTFSRYGAAVRRNRAVTDQFEPGSTFKLVTVAAALEERSVAAGDSVFGENGWLRVNGGVIRDTHPMEWMSIGETIEESSNVGTIKIARRLGSAGLYRYARLFGFGTETGAGLPGEASGDVKHPSRWSGRSLETIAIGQEISSTALQVASAYSVVAAGGLLMRPRITMTSAPDTVRRVVSRKTAATMNAFLESVVRTGTGKNAAVPGYRVAGKTGTAQRAYEDRPGYEPDRYISSFVGYLPADAPELLCLVVVDSPQGTHLASQVAAPVFRKIMRRVLSLRNSGVRHRAQYAAKATENGRIETKTPTLDGLEAEQAIRALTRSGVTTREGLAKLQAYRKPVAVVASQETEEGRTNAMPDVMGVPLRQAVTQLTKAGFRVKATGSGVVVDQFPASGASVRPGTLTLVSCRRNG